jgi:serine/threonine protein phosphatase PrpC
MGNLLGSPVTEKETHTGKTPEGLEYGVSSMQGWRVHMEDAHICEPELYALSPDDKKKIPLASHSLFAVFDGHGGSFAAEYAGVNLCRVLSTEPKFVQYATFCEERAVKEASLTDESERVQYIRSGLDLLEGALRDCFVDIDCEILMATRGAPVPEANVPYRGVKEVQKAVAAPASTSDDDEDDDTIKDTSTTTGAVIKKKIPTPNLDEDAGTTAVVVIVTPHWIVCANAGDSRSVMAKHGHKVVPLSYDHKPDDEEEERRIRAGGGYVAGGRVEGDLAVSRGLGDYRFKLSSTVLMGTKNDAAEDADEDSQNARSSAIQPDDQKVSPIPDVIVQNRSAAQDEFIIVACDGIWDVQTNYECVKTVAELFAEGESDMGLASEEVCCYFCVVVVVDASIGMPSQQYPFSLIHSPIPSLLSDTISLILFSSNCIIIFTTIIDARLVLEHGQ